MALTRGDANGRWRCARALRHAAGVGPLRVLWVTAEVPDPGLGGGNIRQANLLRGLADRFRITVLAAGPREPTRSRAWRWERVWASDGRRRRSWHRVRRDAVRVALTRHGPTDVFAAREARAVLQPRIAALAAEHDIVVLHHLGLLPLGATIDRSRTVVAGHLFHVVHRQLLQRGAAQGGSALERRLLAAEARRAAAREGALERWVDACICVSAADADAFAGVPAIVAPNGVDLDLTRPRRWPPGTSWCSRARSRTSRTSTASAGSHVRSSRSPGRGR